MSSFTFRLLCRTISVIVIEIIQIFLYYMTVIVILTCVIKIVNIEERDIHKKTEASVLQIRMVINAKEIDRIEDGQVYIKDIYFV